MNLGEVRVDRTSVHYLVHREEVLEPDEKIFGEDIPAEMSSHRRTSRGLSELTGPRRVFLYGVRTDRASFIGSSHC